MKVNLKLLPILKEKGLLYHPYFYLFHHVSTEQIVTTCVRVRLSVGPYHLKKLQALCLFSPHIYKKNV